jgi:hypothetical protein
MKCLVEHNEQGTITTIGVLLSEYSEYDEKEIRLELKPRPGHKVITVEVPEITDAKDVEGIIGIKRNYRVEEHQGQHRLVSK